MSDFIVIQNKLEQFIKRYYSNELLKGSILFLSIGVLYFLFTLFIEYMLWLNPTARTILFWIFIVVELALFVKFIVNPISKLFKLQKGINYEDASQIIGNHFPEVKDKLLNALQLKQNKVESELILASIEQKSSELKPIPFKLAINFKNNIKYLKYAAIPSLIVLASYLTGKTGWFSDSYERVVHYRTAYEPPAPFQFFVNNEELKAIENKDFKLIISTVGDLVPEHAQIHYNNESFFLQQIAPGKFEYIFAQPKQTLDFNLSANNVKSKSYNLSVIKTPILLNFEMVLDYPRYIGKSSETLKSIGTTTVPEGTKVTWKVNTKSTDEVSIFAHDTLNLQLKAPNKFEASMQVLKDYDYRISTSNQALKDYENLAFSIKVIKDDYPEFNLKVEKDSIDNQTLYFFGQVSDDYGLSKLQLVYYPSNDEENKSFEQIPVSKSNFDEFISSFPNQLQVMEGVTYELYFQVFDNDAIHNNKSVKSSVFSYRKLTQEEEEQKQLQEQSKTIKDISNTFEKLKEQDKRLEELSKTQKEKKELNFNDKKKFENFLRRQKEQEQLMKNFNEKLQENLDKFQNQSQEKDQFKEDIKDRLREHEEQLKQDEKLLEELEKLQEKIQKEEFAEKLEELAKQNKNKQRSLKQLLELTKRYYVAKKAEKLQQELEQLAQKQEKLSEENKENNTTEKQKDLNKSFDDFQKEFNELQKDNKALQKPLDIPQDKLAEDEIKKDQQEAVEQLEQKEENKEKEDEQQSQTNQNKAKQKQQSAAQKMKKMSEAMKQNMMSGGADQLSEDATMLRQILDNLVLFSFNQEDLMNTFRNIDINNNQYGNYLRNQSGLRENFEHIDDSLFALSLRQPKISEQVNKQITDVFFNIDKSLNELSENQVYQGVSSQQYTVNATNVLASFLSDILDNIEAQMNMAPGQGKGGQDMQLPDIIKSQEELNKDMEEGLKNGEKGKPKNNNGNNPPESLDGKQEGEGEGSNEELNGELYEIYQRQQRLRQALQNKLGNSGEGEAQDALKKMEDIELDLINKGFTNQTLQKMMDLQYQLLKLENAAFVQGLDDKRLSETNYKQFREGANDAIPTAKEYFNTTEILNRQILPLHQVYKKKVQEYFKQSND
ncbi:DUF4175 family protein [Flavobacteriaceae bacterium LMO-SS05]